jgi:hypothetical protein
MEPVRGRRGEFLATADAAIASAERRATVMDGPDSELAGSILAHSVQYTNILGGTV